MTLLDADFDVLYRKHAPGAFRRARRLLGNDADAHEVVQDLFVSLMESPGQFAGGSELTAFMYRAVTNACLNRLRNHRTRRRLLQENMERVASASTPGSLTTHGTRPEQLATLLSELERMPETLALSAVYYYMDGLTHAEIAPLLGCSERQVGNLVTRVKGWSNEEQSA